MVKPALIRKETQSKSEIDGETVQVINDLIAVPRVFVITGDVGDLIAKIETKIFH